MEICFQTSLFFRRYILSPYFGIVLEVVLMVKTKILIFMKFGEYDLDNNKSDRGGEGGLK